MYKGKVRQLTFLTTLLVLTGFLADCKKKTHKQQKMTVPLGEYHSFSLTKYEKPQQFSFLISCEQKAYLNFQFSLRLKTLHRNLYLDIDFETDECIQTHQDYNRVIVNDESWDIELENICCSAENKTKILNQTIKVIVRDGFKILGVPIKTKAWNSFMPILTSTLICLFVWFSNFSQPRADNISFLSRFYKGTNVNKEISSNHLDISIDKVQQNGLNQESSQQKKKNVG